MKTFEKSSFDVLNLRIFCKQLLLFSLLIIFANSIHARDYSIKGKVVDYSGKPIENAEIKTIYIENSVERLTLSVKTDKNGSFEFKKNGDNGKAFDLYIFPEPVISAFTPIRSPFPNSLAKSYPQLVKRKIVLGNSEIINLGKIIVDFPFTIVDIFVNNQLDKPASILVDKASELYLSLYNNKGRLVGLNVLQTLKDVGAINSNSKIRLSLPKGKWKLKICQDYLCKDVVSESNYFFVGKLKSNITIKTKD